MPRIRQKSNIYLAEDFSKLVKAELVLQGLNQHDLAAELGVSDATISILLKDPNKLSVDRLRKIVQHLNISPVSILVFCGYDQKRIREEIVNQ